VLLEPVGEVLEADEPLVVKASFGMPDEYLDAPSIADAPLIADGQQPLHAPGLKVSGGRPEIWRKYCILRQEDGAPDAAGPFLRIFGNGHVQIACWQCFAPLTAVRLLT